MEGSRISDLQELLRARVPHARLGIHGRRASLPTPTGIPALDNLLGGGLPGGDLTEIVGEGPGSGSAQVLHAILRHTAGAGRFLALVDGADSLDIDAEDPGVLARLLWVRCHAAEEALKAADLLLRDRNVPVVAIDLKLNPVAQLRRIPGSVWHRFSRLAEHHGSSVLVITPFPLVGGAAARVAVSLPPHARAMPRDLAPQVLLDALQFDLLRHEASSMHASGARHVA